MLFILKHQLEMLKELEDVILMQANMIYKQNSMSHYQKEMYIKRNKLFKMFHFMILTWQMQDLKVEMIL